MVLSASQGPNSFQTKLLLASAFDFGHFSNNQPSFNTAPRWNPNETLSGFECADLNQAFLSPPLGCPRLPSYRTGRSLAKTRYPLAHSHGRLNQMINLYRTDDFD